MTNRKPGSNRFSMAALLGDEKGNGLVEIALSMPLLAVLLVGGVELGRVAYVSIELSNAAKSAVQYGAQSRDTATDTTGMLTAAREEVGNPLALSLTASTSCICSDGSASTCLSTDCATSYIEQTLTVQTSSVFDPLIYLPGIPRSYTLQGNAVQKIMQR